MPTRLDSIVVDTADPGRLARWWSAALGWPVVFEADTEAVVAPEGEPGVQLTFGFVDDPKHVKNRVHLDLRSESAAHQRQIVERLLAAGASHRDIGQGDVPWVVLADPHGNEFCVLEPRGAYAGTGAVAAVVVDALDPAAMARFWAEASGWLPVATGAEFASLRHPSGRGPFLEFVPVGEPHVVKNRVHLDVAPGPSDPQGQEVERLVALGATPTEVGQSQAPPNQVTWVVLADPEGNEFCVLSPRPWT